MYAKIQNNAPVEWPVHEFQIRSAMTNVSLPATLTAADVAGLGFEPYTTSATPEFNALTQNVEERTPTKQGGTWVQQWAVVELYSEAARAQVLAQDEAAKLEAKKTSVRAERDAKLAACDWRVIKALEGNTLQDFAWAEYRQALRDITAQTGFPWTVNWPVAP